MYPSIPRFAILLVLPLLAGRGLVVARRRQRRRRQARRWVRGTGTCAASCERGPGDDHPAVIATAISLWKALRKALLGSLDDPEGAVRRRLLVEIEAASARLRSDAGLRERLDRMAADAAERCDVARLKRALRAPPSNAV